MTYRQKFNLFKSHLSLIFRLTFFPLNKMRCIWFLFPCFVIHPYTYNRHCDTHYIALYAGTVPNDKKLATICGSKKQELVFQGPNLLLEFNAGYQVPPFDYNGFAANLEFIEGQGTTVAHTVPPPTRNHSGNHHRHATATAVAAAIPAVQPPQPAPPALTEIDWTPAPPKFSPCDKIIIEANGRSGHFDTRGRPFAPNCRLIFKGRPTDVVHISLFNYRLKAQSCRSVIEVIDGALEPPPAGVNNQKKSLHKMCSPVIRHARDQDGNFVPPQTFSSTGSQIMIALRRFHGSGSSNYDHNDEFIDGAYMFHDGLYLFFLFLNWFFTIFTKYRRKIYFSENCKKKKYISKCVNEKSSL